MLSKRDIKLIKSLRLKKHRLTNKLFVVEGKKSINEFIQSNFSLFKLFSIDQQYFNLESKSTQITELDLKRISFLTNPDDHLAIFRIPEKKIIDESKLLLGLDGINDPGNLGTIIRTCDWYNITDIICSNGSVDCFNPKVVQSAMGSLSRVNITYLDLKKYLSSKSFNKTGTFLNGESIFETKINFDKGILVFGNEANGISSKVENELKQRITIPRNNSKNYPESLNLSNSVGIILSQLSIKF